MKDVLALWLPNKKKTSWPCVPREERRATPSSLCRQNGSDIQANIIGLVHLHVAQVLIEMLGNVSVCKRRTPARLWCTVGCRRYGTPLVGFRVISIWKDHQSNLLPASMADHVQLNITFSGKPKKWSWSLIVHVCRWLQRFKKTVCTYKMWTTLAFLSQVVQGCRWFSGCRKDTYIHNTYIHIHTHA